MFIVQIDAQKSIISFDYSDYTSLTDEQLNVVKKTINNVFQDLKELLCFSRQIYQKDVRGKGKFTRVSEDMFCPIKADSYTFLTGYLEIIRKYMFEKKISHLYQEKWHYNPQLDVSPISFVRNLRDYQFQGISGALIHSRGVLVGAVGSGKTVCMAAIVAALAKYKALIIVPKKDLILQVKAEIERFCTKYKIGLADKDYVPGKVDYESETYNAFIGLPIHFVKWNEADLREFPVLLMDECHQSPAVICSNVIKSQNAPYRFGFTATEKGRSDGKDYVMSGLFGPMYHIAEYKDLVASGYNPEIQVELHEAGWEGDYIYIENMLIVNNEKRNNKICKIVYNHINSQKEPLVLVLSRRLEHLKILKEKFFTGNDTVLVTGEVDDRSEIIKDIRARKYKIVLASSVFNEGLNIPEFTLGVNAGGGKSVIQTEQKAGRMARGDVQMVKKWVDFFDVYCNTLERHSLERLLVYKENFGMPVFKDFDVNREKRIKTTLSKNDI